MIKQLLKVGRLLPVLLLCLSVAAWAQERKVSGKVTSADDGSGIPGVNVVEKGTTNGAVTDADGNFSITVGSNATLLFSAIGYASQEVVLGTETVLSISMVTDVTMLSEIVVIGYGTTSVKDATGAVASVTSENFNGGVISSPEQLIQGKTAGVQITTTSGAPGAGVNLRIRGTSSVRSNNNPLFVVDGVPLAGGTQPAAAGVGFGTQQDSNPMNFINPNDIASMSILKDASATAIYGSRGANGVVIITTKSGKGSKGVFDFGSNVSISSPRNRYDLLNPSQFLGAVRLFGGDPVTQNYGSKTDWQDFVMRTAVSTQQNLSYSRGFKTGSVRASGSYEKQNGIIEHSSMTRLTGRLNGNKTFLDGKLNIDLNSTFSHVDREDPPVSGNAGFQGDLLGAAYSANPTWSTDPDFNTGGQRSPANMLEYYNSTGATNRFLSNLSASYNISKSLSAKATYGLDFSKGDNVTLLTDKALNAGDGVFGFGQGQLSENKNINHLVELTMNYNKQVGTVKIEAVGGYSFQSFNNEWMWAAARGFSDFSSFSKMETELRDSFEAGNNAAGELYADYNNWGISDQLLDGPPSTPTSGGFVSGIDFGDATLSRDFFSRPSGATVDAIAANFYNQTDFLQSFFGRGNFTLSDKYMFTATVRVDGSSKFGDNTKYGVFPSGAFAWKMHDEAFMPDLFSTFKVRAGYGIVGNQDGLGYGNFVRRERFNNVGIETSRAIRIPGTGTQGFANLDLKWEQTSTAGAGIDFGIWNEKLSGSFDVYVKNTTDLLFQFNAAQPALSPVVFQNLDAVVENKGWELSLAYNIVEKDDASFTVAGNVSYNKNMLKDFAGAIDAGRIYGQGLSGAYAQRLAGGYPLFSYHLREFEGFDSETGQPIGDNQTFVGKTALPTWNMGFSLNGTFKGFDFSTYLTGQFGHYIYNNTQNGFFTAGAINNARNVTKDVLLAGEAGTAEAAVSTRFLSSGDFVRMQNFTVGYSLPLQSKTIKRLRFYVNGQNLFVLTNYNGLDPEVSSSPASFDLLNGIPTAGIDYAAYPRPRTYTIGLNLSF